MSFPDSIVHSVSEGKNFRKTNKLVWTMNLHRSHIEVEQPSTMSQTSLTGAVVDFSRSCLPGRNSRLDATCVHVNHSSRPRCRRLLHTRFALRQYESPFRQKGSTLRASSDKNVQRTSNGGSPAGQQCGSMLCQVSGDDGFSESTNQSLVKSDVM